ncbi:MAG TPA: copper chaperone PCu(A)C [Steroidobacteraceae bacterium]|nr:copper chaperone PCu(A)C [Steroidobacteraceae bacterium]
MRAPHARLGIPLSLLVALAQALPSAAQPAAPVSRAGPAATRTPSTANNQTLVAQDAWVRATPGVDMAVAYLTLRNASASAVTVTGVESPIAGHAMIHETKVEGGQSKMRPHEQLVVAPGATIKLEPGGLHVMLHDLKQPLTVGQKVPLVIQLAGGGTIQASALVRPLGAE